MDAVEKKSLSEVHELLVKKEISGKELTESCIKQIEKTEQDISALLAHNFDQAIERAKEFDANPIDSPVAGIPLIIKDALVTKGLETTCASRILKGFTPVYDASAVSKLKTAGSIILAKANMDEFAMGSSTENSAYQTTKNPWNLSHVSGGSSGGSAACVAACQSFGSLGTDTGGSIRQPASFCGIVGLKPTYGRVSRFGLIAYGSSLDQIGPMTRTVEDSARILQVIAGFDKKDATSADVAVADYISAAKNTTSLQGKKIGVPKEYWADGIDDEVRIACENALKNLQSLGAELVPVSLPMTEYAIATYYIIAMSEASSNLSRFDGIRYGHRTKEFENLEELYALSRTEGFGEEVQRRIILGTYALSSGYYDAYYKKASQVRRKIREDFTEALKKCDVLIAPVSPCTAFPLGAKIENPITRYLQDIFTVSLNLAGLCGISIPVGIGHSSQLPVGIQFMGKAFDEESIISVAAALEKSQGAFPLAPLVA